MDLNAVKLFVQAAEAGSISAAARMSGVPLPTLSRQLRKLEDQLGTRLLERGPRGLALTPAGSQLISDAQPALASLAQAEQRLQAPLCSPAGAPLTLSTSNEALRWFVLPQEIQPAAVTA